LDTNTEMKKDGIGLAIYFAHDGTKQVVTIRDYLALVKQQDKNAIAQFVYGRFYSRYLKPFTFNSKQYRKEFKNGFSMMANCCLLIEVLQSFKNGWGDSNGKSGRAFKEFFETEGQFVEMRNVGKDFFKNVRCGILHQGETTGGWTIDRAKRNLIDGKRIHANVFIVRLEKSLKEYCNKLRTSNWDSEVWQNCRAKMRTIISNC
jgi:hypothetical protein